MAATWRSRTTLILATVFALGAVGLFVAAPYMTAWQMKQAVDSRDAISLADHVDFPAMRESVRAHVQQVIRKIEGDGGLTSPLAQSLLARATEGMTRQIDARLSPEGLRAIYANEAKRRNESALGTIEMVALSRDGARFQMYYETFDRFAINVRDAGNDEVLVVFLLARDGIFSWKLSAVRLPL